MSILRSSARCPALLARLALTQNAYAYRTLSSSVVAHSDKPVLPSRDWGAFAPKPKQQEGGEAGGARRGGGQSGGGQGAGGGSGERRRGGNQPSRSRDPQAGQQSGQRPRDGGQQRPQRSRTGNQQDGQRARDGSQRGGQRRDGNQQGVQNRGNGGSGFGMRRDGGEGNRVPGGPRTSWAERGGSSSGAGPSGVDKWAARKPQQRPGQGRDSPPATSATPTKDAEARPARVFSTPDIVDDGGFDDSERYGKGDRHHKARQAHQSRSLLHNPEGDYSLPPARHRSDKKGKAVKGAGAADRDRARRQWAIEEEPEEDDQLAKALEAQRLKAEQKRLQAAEERRKAKANEEKAVFIPSSISVIQLATKCGVKLFHMQRKMKNLGMTEEQRRPDYLLNADEASNVAIEFDLNPIVDADKGFDIYPEPEEDPSAAPLRPPVVTIMGHVDHGKTTLLDALRHTQVAAGEAGGITQHIGAFSVPLASLQPGADSDATITFLDTPGHAAFSGMRARGASVTDLVVLVVAADDGVMPQTKEVINLVKAEGDNVGLVVAINKCDKPMIDVERVKSALGAEGVLLEEDGGDVPGVRVSGLAKTGLDDLVETLATLAEVRDLRARREGKAEGYVLESRVDKGLGSVTTVLVTRGTLRTGSSIVAGRTWARVRQMMDSAGNIIDEAGPGTPVQLTGWKDVPGAGDQLLEAASEDAAKKCVTNRHRDAERLAMAADAEQINARRQEERARALLEAATAEAAKASGSSVTAALHAARRKAEAGVEVKKELRLVIKADVSGTVEATVGALQNIGNKEAGVKIVHTGVGDVSDSDVTLAEASGATIIGFSVDCPRSIKTAADSVNVPILTDSVIYRLIDAVRARVIALLPPKLEYRITGEATVQQLFPIKLGKKETKVIAGCRVSNGVLNKAEGVRVLRGPDRTVVFEGTMDTLKHLKKDVTEIRKGMECGVGLEGFEDVREGDEIVTFVTFEVAREL